MNSMITQPLSAGSIPRKILVIRLSALGDVVLTTPAVRLLSQKYPDAEIHWLTEAPYVSMLSEIPGIRPLGYDKRGTDSGFRGLLNLRKRLKAQNYDLVVDLQNKPKTAFLRTAGKRAVAFRKRTFTESLASLFGRGALLKGPHSAQALAEALFPLGIVLPDDESSRAQALMPKLFVSGAMDAEADSQGIPCRAAASSPGAKPLVGLAPGARWETKRWPGENFAALAKKFEEKGAQILLIGARGDRDEFDRIRGILDNPENCFDTAELSVGGLCGAVSRCSLVISGDSGPAHIAAAFGIPTLAIFGPTDPARWAPRGPKADFISLSLPCSPCSNYGGKKCPLNTHACMRELQVGAVFEKALSLSGIFGDQG